MLFMKKQFTEDVKRLTSCYKELKTETATIQFIPVEEYQNLFPRFSNVFYDDVDPLNSVAENIPPLACINNDVKFTIVTKNTRGDLCSKGGGKVIAQVQSAITGDIFSVKVLDNQNGSYTASFVPKQVGEITLSIIISGRHIKGSPSSVTVLHRDYLALHVPSKVVNDSGRMDKPWGIAFDKNGMWAVADNANHYVYIFNSRDQLVKKFGSKGKGHGQFNLPMGIAFDIDNYLYVVDANNHRVQKFNACGSVWQLWFK